MPVELGESATAIEQTAAELLSDAVGEIARPIQIGTPASNALIRGQSSELPLETLGEEGFVARLIADAYVVAANGPRGVLYGCAAVADQLRMGKSLDVIRLRDKPVLAERVLWVWGQPKSNPNAFLTPDRMRNVENDPGLRTFGRYLAQARVNAVTIWPDLDVRPDLGPGKETSLEAYRIFTHWLRHNFGIDVYLFTWYEIQQGTPTPIRGWPLCTFDPKVIAYWQQWSERLIRELPDLNGVVMAGAGGDWIRGPWECQCDKCMQLSNRELLRRAIDMIGRPWADKGGRLIWKAVTDRPSLVKTEVENFANLDETLPEYVRIAHKPFYKDFRQPHPLQPIFYAHKDQDHQERPYIVEFQIYGEYRGGTEFPCAVVDRWGEVAPLLTRKNYVGSMGIFTFHDRSCWDHPLNLVNWYAWGRYAWNPDTPPDEIYRDWATMTFGAEAADAVVDICRKTYQASTKLMFFKGVMTQNHSKLPTIDYELESSLVGPWHHIPKARDGYIGREHDVSMYPPEIAEQIRNNPNLELWAKRIPITAELCDKAIAEKREALQIIRDMSANWDAIPHNGWDDQHRDISQRFKRNVVDAQVWYENQQLYWDYKAGRLTREELRHRIDDIKSSFDPNTGTGLISETFDRFIEEWERVYSGNLVRRSMEGQYQNPEGEPFLPGLKGE